MWGNVIVEIDETLISKKRKYHRGRYYEEVWLFGGVERGSGKWFAEIVKDRSRETLMELIKKYIKKITIIYSDEWKGYYSELFDLSDISGYNYTHKNVNQSENFVRPGSDVHTNTIEGLWGTLRWTLKRREGRNFSLKLITLILKCGAAGKNFTMRIFFHHFFH